MKKIAIIVERADITLGGAERSVFELTSALLASDFDVNVVAAKGRTDTKNFHILYPRKNTKRTCFCNFEKAVKKQRR